MSEQRANQVLGGTFLIGLAVLVIINWWWPGILYVAGIALLARGRAQGRKWSEDYPGLIVLALAVIFTLGDVLRLFSFNWLPILLILVGLYLLFGNRWSTSSRRKSAQSKQRDDVV